MHSGRMWGLQSQAKDNRKASPPSNPSPVTSVSRKRQFYTLGPGSLLAASPIAPAALWCTPPWARRIKASYRTQATFRIGTFFSGSTSCTRLLYIWSLSRANVPSPLMQGLDLLHQVTLGLRWAQRLYWGQDLR